MSSDEYKMTAADFAERDAYEAWRAAQTLQEAMRAHPEYLTRNAADIRATISILKDTLAIANERNAA